MKTLSLCTFTAGLFALSSCASFSGGPRTPDEFRVVTKAPLVVPPDYNLRPPTPGQSQPVEVDPARVAATTAFVEGPGADASASEKALIAAADANAVSALIRAQVDYEEAKIIRKADGVADNIIGWDDPSDSDSDNDSATGGAPVTIERSGGDRIKLPGT